MKKFLLLTIAAALLAGCSFEIKEADEEQEDAKTFEIFTEENEE
ncbi:lipoprotein [Jeotgalibacillus terrae]|uniref:Lipoprotein n=1 Tax=Jeotgalibacillus terrae TaxID=587735 RepID=A0ABW5ZI97_9BACL|nr:lipoprotein [Jeotgalibacillus terrae]MBM7578665.1 outer membrane biogenesis lipoprotein LolB [Jeotgalibacillus terrae]